MDRCPSVGWKCDQCICSGCGLNIRILEETWVTLHRKVKRGFYIQKQGFNKHSVHQWLGRKVSWYCSRINKKGKRQERVKAQLIQNAQGNSSISTLRDDHPMWDLTEEVMSLSTEANNKATYTCAHATAEATCLWKGPLPPRGYLSQRQQPQLFGAWIMRHSWGQE